ncbi:MAG: hypothetical protein FWE27_10040 [Defluviitaleaceae bacterium]|nr:hypothetical protein [Defluviitaleaceae bacterium]
MGYGDAVHADHITYEEMERFFNLNPDALTSEDITLMDAIDNKIEHCSVCHRRYSLFSWSQRTFGAYGSSPLEFSPINRIIELLHDRIGELNTTLNNNVGKWLDGLRNVLGSFEQSSLRPAMSGGTRGTAAELAVTVTVGEVGTFDFELSETVELVFKVARRTEYGQPVCLVVLGRGDTDFFQVYELSGFDFGGLTSEDLTSDRIKLSAGEYSICVPTIGVD